MKKTIKERIAPVVIIALAAIFWFGIAGCKQSANDGPPQDDPIIPISQEKTTPVAGDFTITGLQTAYNGEPKAVSITPKTGKSQGQITIYYVGIGSTNYSKSTTAPLEAGSYAVTFDVAEASGFNARTGLSAGTLVIGIDISTIQYKRVIDFEDSVWAGTGYAGRTVICDGFSWKVMGVVNPDDNDRRNGAKSIRFRSNSSDTIPNGIELVNYINEIKSIYFDYGSYSSHSGGTIILYYQTKGSADWEKAGEVVAPGFSGSMEKAYFNVNKTGGVRFKIEKEIIAASTSVNIDDIIIVGNSDNSFNKIAVDPVAGDFSVTGLSALYDGSPKAVTILPKAGMSSGERTIYYEGTSGTTYAKSTTAPSAAGSYNVTFDIAAVDGFNEARGMSAGTLVIEAMTDPFFTVDFENSAWAGTSYTLRTVTTGGHAWAVTGVGTMDTSGDHFAGLRSIRLRGNAGDNCYVEMTDYVTDGIKTISFEYASYGSHANGNISLYYQVSGSSDWEKAGSVTAPSWANGGSVMQKSQKFDINKTGNVRFKIVRDGSLANSTSVNIDNIVITTY